MQLRLAEHLAFFAAVALFAIAAGVFFAGCTPEAGFMAQPPRYRPEERPIAVCLSAYVGEPNTRIVSKVVWTINRRVGFTLLALAPGDCDVTLTLGVPVEPGSVEPGGYAIIHADREDGVRCEAGTVNTGTDELEAYTIQHELGHCLGLAHDDFTSSIMRRVQTPMAWTEPGEEPQWPPHITDSDRRLLIATYR